MVFFVRCWQALVPYLIIVRVGLGLTHRLPNAYKEYTETTASGSTRSNPWPVIRMDRLGSMKFATKTATTGTTISELKVANNSMLSV